MSARYCGRDFSGEELTQIRRLISDNPGSSRAVLSRLTCRLLQWYKADGGLKEMSARVAMLRMQEDGLITLSPPRSKRPDPTVRLTHRTDPATPIDLPAGKLAPLVLQRVQQKANSRLWNEYIQRYHYLGRKPLPGAQLRYFIHAGGQPIALLGFGAAAWQTAPRDHYIGWSHDQRKQNLHLIVNKASAPGPAPYLHPCRQYPIPDPTLGSVQESRLDDTGHGRQATSARLVGPIPLSTGANGDFCRETSL